MDKKYCLQLAECSGGSGAPVGTVISYMGTKAPEHYLICDGSELSIAAYPELTKQISDEFGVVNYFGGDGITTFAVPDLRNEFLRGHHGNATEQKTADIGIHQEPTCIPYIWRGQEHYWVDPLEGGYLCTYNTKEDVYSTNFDSKVNNATATGCKVNTKVYDTDIDISKYTVRPTNVAVLFCIKYEA